MAETELERFLRIGRALDGDSLVRKDGSVTRVLGGNTPERMHVNAGESLPDMPGSVAATYALQRSLDNGAEVTDTGERGFFGRPLQRVTDEKGDVMGDMVALGLADPSAENTYQQFRENVERPEWDDLVEHARQEKAQFVDRRFESMVDALFGSTNYRGRQVSKQDGGWEITKDAVARGTDQFQGSLYAFANVLGETFGSDVLSEYGEEGMFRNMYEAALNPARVASYEDIDGYRDLGLYVLETVAENSPALAVDIVAGAATGGATVLGKQALAGIGKSAMRKFGMSKAMTGAGKLAEQAWSLRGVTTSTGAKVGMAGSMFPQMAGETRMGQYRDGLENEDGAATQALVTGGLQTGLELVGLQKMLGNVMKGLDPDDAGSVMGLVKEAKDVQGLLDVLGRAAGLGLSGGATETVTEITQELISQISTMGLDPDMEVSFDNLDETALTEAGARAFAFGGPVTAAGATVTGVAAMREKLRQEVLKGQQPTTDDTAPEPVDNLKAHAEVRGAVWLSSQQTAEEKEALRAELAKRGEVFERTNDAGATYLTTRSDDPLLNPDVALTGDELTRQKGFVPKSELAEGEERHTAVVRDAQGREVEAIVTDDTNLDSTLTRLDELYPELTVAVEPAEQVLAKRQEALETQRLGDLPPSEARDAQDAQSRPAPEAERGTRDAFDDRGRLRPIGELWADYRSGRLSKSSLGQALRIYEVDPKRYVGSRVATDRARTMDAIRRRLSSDKELAAKYSGIKDPKVIEATGVYELADWAVKALTNGSNRQLRQALRDLDMQPSKEAVLTRHEVDPKTGKVLSVDGRKYLLPRIKARLKGKLAKAQQDRVTRRFVGEGGSIETLLGQLDSMSDNDLIGLAETLGADTKGLTADGPGTLDDVAGMFRELDQKARQTEAPGLSEQELYDLIPIGDRPLSADTNQPPVADLQNPERVRNQRFDPDSPQLGLDGIAPAWGTEQTVTPERVLDREIQETKQAARTPDLFDEPEEAEPVENDAPRRLFIAQAARDIGIIDRLSALIGLPLDRDKLLQAYWRWHWPTSNKDEDKVTPVLRDKADVDQAIIQADPEAVQGRLRNLIRYAVAEDTLADERIAPQDKADAAAGGIGTEQEAEQTLATGLKLLAAEYPDDPEGAIVGALTEHNLLGEAATHAEEAIMSPNSSTGSAVAEGYPGVQERDPQEQSDLVFYRALYQSTMKLRENRFLEQDSEYLSPHDWSDAEHAYQSILATMRSDPAGFVRDFAGTHLPKLIELNAVRFTSRLSQFTVEGESRARAHTLKAEGKNLLLVEFSGTFGPVHRVIDAVSLANYAKDRHPANGVEALANLESNLARLAQGPESSNVSRTRTHGFVDVSDDLVIWFTETGIPVTAGQARQDRQKQQRASDSVVEASRRKERAVEELESVEQVIEATLDQLEDRDGLTDADRQGIAAIRNDLDPDAPFDPAAQRRSAAARTRRLELARQEVESQQRRLDDLKRQIAEGQSRIKPERQAAALARAEARLNTVKAKMQAVLDSAVADVEAERRLKSVRNHVAQLADIDLGNGVVGQLKTLLDRRISLLSEIAKLNQRISYGASDVDTSLRGWEAELSGELDYRSENDIDEDGFDQEVSDQSRYWYEVEGENHEDEVGDPTPTPLDQAVFAEPQADVPTTVEAAVDAMRQGAEAGSWESVSEGRGTFIYLSPTAKGFRMPVDGTLPKAQKPKAKTTAKKAASSGRKFSGAKVAGKAANRKSMQALASFTRRLIITVAKGMTGEQRTRFLNTPLIIVETGDTDALKQVLKDTGQLHLAHELGKLAARPGYINLGPVSVISMDRLTPSMNPAEWALVFGHELGHMVYDQSWHLMSEDDKAAIIRIYTDSYGASGYNGRDGGLGFKEWFADQMSAAIAKDVTANRPGAYNDASGVLGKAMRFIMRNLKAMWAAIQKGQATRKLTRFKLNLEFETFAERILTGKMPMSHRYNLPFAEVQTLHFTPDEPPLPRAGIEARMKQVHKGKLKPTGLIRSVIGRIRDYSTELANLLHQSANQSRAGDGAYEQKRYAMGNLWMVELQKAYDQIGRGRNQQGKVNQAYAELREGKDTAGAKALRDVLDRIIADAKKRGWASGYSLEANFVPRAFNPKAVEAKRGRLFELAKEALPKATDEEINEQIDRIVDGFGLQELSHEPMGPGRPVGTHAGAKTLLDAVGSEKLTKEGLLQDKGYGILQHFAAGLAKRTAWESTFGGYVDKEGRYSEAMQSSAKRLARAGETVFFDPNARYKQLLETIAAEHGDHAAAEVKDLVLGAMGHRNLGVKKWARVSQEWATGITNLMILGFSGVASIPELATAFVRADFGFADIAASLRNYGEAKRFAYDIGVAMTTGAEQAMRESMGEGYQSSAINKANSVFFTLNGQQFITRLSRTVGTAVAMRYVLKAAAEGDYASLKKLGLTPEQVRQWDRAGRPAYTADMQGPLAETALAVSNGVSQFVNEGTLNPNKFQSANWGNNPYMKVIWHLKQFLWTFGDTVVGGIARSVREQYQQGKAMGYSAPLSALMATATPMWAMGLMMPLAAMSLALRGLLAGQDRFEDEEVEDLALELMRKTGAFAQWDLLHGLLTANKWDQGFVSYAGAVIPMVSVGDQILAIDGGKVDVEQSARNLAGMTPLVGQWKGAWQWLLE